MIVERSEVLHGNRKSKCSKLCKNSVCFCFMNKWGLVREHAPHGMQFLNRMSIYTQLSSRSERNFTLKVCEKARSELIADFWQNSGNKWHSVLFKLSPLNMWNDGLNLIVSETLCELQVMIAEISKITFDEQPSADEYPQLCKDLVIPHDFSLRSRLYECGHHLHNLVGCHAISQRNVDHLIKLNSSLSRKINKIQKKIGHSERRILEMKPCLDCPRYQKLLQESKNQLSEVSKKFTRSNSEREKIVMKYATSEKNLIVAQKSLQTLEKKNKLIIEENSSLKQHIDKLQDGIVQLSKTLRAKDSEILRLKDLSKTHEESCQKLNSHETKQLLASPRKMDEVKASKEQQVNVQIQTESDASYAEDKETQTIPLTTDFSITSDPDDCKEDQVTELLTTSGETDGKELEIELEEVKKRETHLLDFIQKLVDKNVELQQNITDCKEELRHAQSHSESLIIEIDELNSKNNELQHTVSSHINDCEILADYAAQQVNVNQRLLHEVEELTGANSILRHREVYVAQVLRIEGTESAE